jgi:hypothetical protein
MSDRQAAAATALGNGRPAGIWFGVLPWNRQLLGLCRGEGSDERLQRDDRTSVGRAEKTQVVSATSTTLIALEPSGMTDGSQTLQDVSAPSGKTSFITHFNDHARGRRG